MDLTITYFRDVSALGRQMLGVLSGKDGLDVEVSVIDIASGETTARFSVSNYNYTAVDNTGEMGIMLPVSKKIVECLTGEKEH